MTESILLPESELWLKERGIKDALISTGSAANDESLEALEIKLLLEGVYALYGFDFRDYAFSSLRRRVLEAVMDEGMTTVSQLQERVFRDRLTWERLFRKLSVNVTSFFRTPDFYRAFREQVVPLLRDHPFLRIWHAGCATGEEVYSTAILLHEEGLLERCRIYATDMNESVLRYARTGIYSTKQLELSELQYRQSGGTAHLTDYYSTKYEHSMLHRSLRENVLFSQHNLVTDGSFNEFHLIFARNVLIYFNKSLQDRVHTLLYESLTDDGVLGLGERETVRYTPFATRYAPVMMETNRESGLYRKVS